MGKWSKGWKCFSVPYRILWKFHRERRSWRMKEKGSTSLENFPKEYLIIKTTLSYSRDQMGKIFYFKVSCLYIALY